MNILKIAMLLNNAIHPPINEVIPSGDNWQEVEFTITNPTSSPAVINLFDIPTPLKIPSSPSLTPPAVIITSIPVGITPVGVAFCPVNNAVYVCNQTANTISVIDGNTDLVIATLTGSFNVPTAIVYNPVNNMMYVTNNGSGSVNTINCATNAVGSIALGFNSFGITYNTINNTVYVCCSGFVIKVINCVSNTISATIPIAISGSVDITFNPYNNNVYFVGNFSNVIYPINCATNIVGASIPVGTAPFFITYSNISNKIYVANTISNDVTVLNGATNAFITTIPVGTTPNCIVFDPEDNFVYVGNFTSNDITAIKCSTDVVFGTSSGFNTPSGIGFNSQNNSLYISSQSLNTVTRFAPIQRLYITSSSFDYNQFLSDCSVNPKVIKQIVLSTDPSQLNNNIQIQRKDMYGNYDIDWKYPNLQVSKFMYQNSIVELNFKKSDLILDVYTSFQQYVVNPNTSIIMLLYYKEAIAAEKLNRNGVALQGTCMNLRLPNCSLDATDKTGLELIDFGEPVITIEEVLKNK